MFSSALSLSQHDALAQIQNRLDSMDQHQSTSSSLDLHAILNAVKEVPVMCAELSRLTQSVNHLVIGAYA